MQRSNKASKTDLDLVQYCKRAIGEFQGIHRNQGTLGNVEEVEIPLPDGEFPVFDHLTCQQFNFRSRDVKPFKAISITYKDVYHIDPANDTGPPIRVGNGYMIPPPPPGFRYLGDVHNIQTWLTPPQSGHADENDFRNLYTEEELVNFYWGVVLQSSDIVLGILESIPALKKLGYKRWILPTTDDKIALEDLQLGLVDVIPNKHFLISGERYIPYEMVQFPGTYILQKISESKSRIYCHHFDPEFGPVYRHSFLEATLPSGTTLVIDPTARKLGYQKKSPNGIVICDSWDDWENSFPGIVKGKFETVTKDMYAEQFHLGNGPKSQNITRLKKNIIKYFERRICKFCGQVEGVHEEPPDPIDYYDYKNVVLKNCGKCKSVAYCGKLCQKLDWKNHKPECDSDREDS